MTTSPPPPPPIHRKMKPSGALSFSQESLWFLQQLDPENNAYNSTFLYKFTGGLDRLALERAINELIRRHEPLRACYPNQAGRPVQVIQPFRAFSLPFVDLSGLADGERGPAIQQKMTELGDRPYNLQRGPLVRAALLHSGPEEDILIFGTHHIGTDAWSRQVLGSDLMRLYDAFSSGKEPDLPELPIQYSDYAAWQREWLSGEALTAYVDHWKEILAGELPIIEPPTDRPRPMVQTYHGARYPFIIAPPLLSQVKSCCQKERITTFHFLMAAYALMLMRYTGQEDIIMGCPFANRSRPELDGLVGLFVNTLPVRVNLAGNPTTRELLNQVRAIMLDAFSWQAAPFEALVSEISPERDLGRTPVFQVTINLRNVPMQRRNSVEGLNVEEILRENIPAPFDLSLEFGDENGSLIPYLQYNRDLYDETTIIHMAAHYQNLLGEMVQKMDRPISEMEMLAPSEKKRIVFDWNDNGMDFPQACVHELVSEQAKKNPGSLAVVCNEKTLTYDELEKKANQLGNYLRKSGVGAETRVGIYLPRSEKMVIAVLATLKAGGAYVPFDLIYPPERVAYMIRDSDPAVIITLSDLVDQLPAPVQKICLDAESASIDACGIDAPPAITNNDSLIYLTYTSGSTGRPKGAMNTHKGIVNYFTYLIRQYHFNAADRVIQITSLSFDLSIFEILGTLSYGGSIYLMDDSQMRDPDFIQTAIIKHQITVLSLVPTMLRALSGCALVSGKKENHLRVIMPGGEALLGGDVDLARKAYGDSALILNHYGPTECSIAQTTYAVPALPVNSTQIVSIGKPISNTRAYILDKYLHPVPVGVAGEMYIGGIGVGRGYWNQPELTAKQFLPDPFFPGGRMYRSGDIVRHLPDGSLCFLGRSDDQVKIRGYRVELKEIEAVVNEFPGVKNAAVVLQRPDGREKLSAYISLFDGSQEFSTEKMQSYLKERLPFYMLPSSITVLEELPLAPNRKVDRLSLRATEAGIQQGEISSPRNDVEKRLVSIWKEVLGVDRVGIRDNFFELGGHSLLAVRLFSRIQQEFGQTLPLLLLFKESTVEALAAALAGTGKPSEVSGVIPIQPEGNQRPIFILPASLYMRDLALALGASRPVYGLRPVDDGKMVFRDSIQETAKIYFQNLVRFDPNGPYLLLGHSGHGYIAIELARLLRKEGKKVAFLGLIDSYYPGALRQASLIERINIHRDNLKGKDLAGVVKYVLLSTRRLIARWRRAAMGDEAIGRLERQGRVKEVRNLVIQAYRPEPYDGQITLFSAAQHPQYYKGWDPMQKWTDTFTGAYEIIPQEGDHMSMLEPPLVTKLAGEILTILRRDESR